MFRLQSDAVRHSGLMLKIMRFASYETKFDIAIVGGGVIGACTAVSLASHPQLKHLKTALIEPQNMFTPHSTIKKHSNRVVALSPSSVALLADLGAWGLIDNTKFQSFDRMYVWDSESSNEIIFNSDKTIATIVENARVQESLVKVLQRFPNVTILNREHVEDVVFSSNQQTLKLSSGKTINSELIIGADGPNSIIRTKANINAFGWMYNQVGVVATLNITQCINHTAWQRFLPSGTIAMLPVSNTQSSLVWSINRELSEKIVNLPQDDFVHLVNAAFNNPVQDLEFFLSNIANDGTHKINFKEEVLWGKYRDNQNTLVLDIPTILESGNRSAFPLRLQHTDSYSAPGAVLIG